MSVATLTDKLESVLEQEYHALLSGSLDQIETLGREKLGLLERMSELSVRELESFITFRDRLFRNQNLAQSAIAGMRKAINRTKDITDVSSGLRTYGPDGQHIRFAAKTSGGLSKRS